MKKISATLFLLLLFPQFLSAKELRNVGIAKYAVLEVLDDRTPLRLEDNENAKRLTHLFKNSVLFADKENTNYFRVELENNKYAWINKKFVEVQGVIPEKRFSNIDKISFKEDKKKYLIKIEMPEKSAFTVDEIDKNLDFTLFDSHFDPIETKTHKFNNKFEISKTIENKLSIKYFGETPIFGYDVENIEDVYHFSIKKAPKVNSNKPLKNITVVIDPGHGGIEKGACAFGLEEKNINLQISKKLRRALKKKGANVYLTRKRDKQISLIDRINFSKEKNADILLSIHQNSLPNRKDINIKHGVGTYYYHNQAKPLAEHIQNNLLNATNFKDDKVNYASFALTRPTHAISVLVECGYIIKKDEAEKISNKKFQNIIAKAIAQGCEDYLKETFN